MRTRITKCFGATAKITRTDDFCRSNLWKTPSEPWRLWYLNLLALMVSVTPRSVMEDKCITARTCKWLYILFDGILKWIRPLSFICVPNIYKYQLETSFQPSQSSHALLYVKNLLAMHPSTLILKLAVYYSNADRIQQDFTFTPDWLDRFQACYLFGRYSMSPSIIFDMRYAPSAISKTKFPSFLPFGEYRSPEQSRWIH